MRVLFSSTAGSGHVLPLLPLARAFRDAGTEVSFASAPSWRERVEAEGFRFLPAGLEVAAIEAGLAAPREELRRLPPEQRRPHAFTSRFATLEAPERLAGVRDAAAASQPDLIVHESGDLTAPLVAAELGVRSVHHSWGKMVPLACFEQAAATIDPLWRAAGLEPRPLCGAFGDVYVDVCPPGLADESPPPEVRVERLRPATVEAGVEPPVWLAALPERPTVYVTFGTIFNDPSLFRLVLTALDGLDCNVVATVGDRTDPQTLGSLPSNVHVEGFVPQALILPFCDAVVTHGGSGSTLGALAHGLPLLLVPQGADQFDNAAACARAGVAQVLMPGELEADAVRAAVSELLESPGYATRAGELAAEIAGMPTAADVVRTLVAER